MDIETLYIACFLCLLVIALSFFFIPALPSVPALTAILCYVYIQEDTTGCREYYIAKFHLCGKDFEKKIYRTTLTRIALMQGLLLVLSCVAVVMYVYPIGILLSPKFASHLTRVHVSNCTADPVQDTLHINDEYVLYADKCPSVVYHCDMTTQEVSMTQCRLHIGDKADIAMLVVCFSLAIVDFLTVSLGCVAIAKTITLLPLHR